MKFWPSRPSIPSIGLSRYRIAVRLIPIDDWWVSSGTASIGIPGPIADLARTKLPAVWQHPAD